jgi:hypothetical protein
MRRRQVMRAKCSRLPRLSGPSTSRQTGGDGKGTLNISTACPRRFAGGRAVAKRQPQPVVEIGAADVLTERAQYRGPSPDIGRTLLGSHGMVS